MSLKLYLDFMSQPSRAIYILLKLNKIPFELCPVALRKCVHMTVEFKDKYNRFQKVPFIHDGDFKLSESVAILRYLSDKHNVDTNWYPKDLKKRALVDEYLEWQHNNTRIFCASYFRQTWLIPFATGKPLAPEKVKKYEKDMVKCLDQIEEVWLGKTPYFCGAEISAADVFGACELEQPRIAGFDITAGRTTLKTWLDKVRNETKPFYDEAHVIVNKMIKK